MAGHNPLGAQPLVSSQPATKAPPRARGARRRRLADLLLQPPVLVTLGLLLVSAEVVLWVAVGPLLFAAVNALLVAFVLAAMVGRRKSDGLLGRVLGGRSDQPGGAARGGLGRGPFGRSGGAVPAGDSTKRRGGLGRLLGGQGGAGSWLRGRAGRGAKGGQSGAGMTTGRRGLGRLLPSLGKRKSTTPGKRGGPSSPGSRSSAAGLSGTSPTKPTSPWRRARKALGDFTSGVREGARSKGRGGTSKKPASPTRRTLNTLADFAEGVREGARGKGSAGPGGERPASNDKPTMDKTPPVPAGGEPTPSRGGNANKPASAPRHAPGGDNEMGVRHDDDASLQRWGRNLRTIAPALEDLAKTAEQTNRLAAAITSGVKRLAGQGEIDLPADPNLVAEAEAIAAELKAIQAEDPTHRLRALAARAEVLAGQYHQRHEVDEARLSGERGGRHKEKRADVSTAEKDV